MLRLYSVMQLEHLWSKPSTKRPRTTVAATTFTPFPPFFGDDMTIDDDSILDVHPVAVETTEFQEPHQQERKEEGLTTGYKQQAKPITTSQRPEHQATASTSSSSTSLSLTVSVSDQALSTSLKELSTMPSLEEHHVRYKQDASTLKAKHQPIHNIHFQQPPYDFLPPLTYDLTSITEENNDQVNDSSLISTSTGSSFPVTPTSTFSTPMPSTRQTGGRLHHPLKDFKFSERRKNMTNKLKRAFSTNHHGKRNNNRSVVPS